MLFPPTVSRFCGCCSLRAGAYIIGSIYIISGLLTAIGGSLSSSSTMDHLKEWYCDGHEKGSCLDVDISVITGLYITCGVISIFIGETPEPLLIKACSLSGLIGVVGTYKNNSCLVGTFTVIYSIIVVTNIFGALGFLISFHSTAHMVSGPGLAITIIPVLASTALSCYWAVCLYSLWKEMATHSA
jgi:hypothetical protein